jgi:hypothetical protein
VPGPATTLLREASRRIQNSSGTISAAAGQVIADEITKQLATDGSRFDGKRLTVTVTNNGPTTSVAAGGSIGGWTILNTGSKAHVMRARKGRTSKAMNIPGVGWRTGPWDVRGVRGKGTWTKSVARAKPKVEHAAEEALGKVLHG